MESHVGLLITTEPMIAETGWLLDRQIGAGAEAAFYRSIADGEVEVEPLARGDWKGIAALTEQYADQHVGGVDAGLVVEAERLGRTAIATLDRRQFGVVRPSHAKALTLVP